VRAVSDKPGRRDNHFGARELFYNKRNKRGYNQGGIEPDVYRRGRAYLFLHKAQKKQDANHRQARVRFSDILRRFDYTVFSAVNGDVFARHGFLND